MRVRFKHSVCRIPCDDLLRPCCSLFALRDACSGVDGLAGDPVAHCWSLTPAAYHAAAAAATEWMLPLLVLGGGGYDSPAAACAWGGVVAALQGREAPEDVPEHAYFDR